MIQVGGRVLITKSELRQREGSPVATLDPMGTLVSRGQIRTQAPVQKSEKVAKAVQLNGFSSRSDIRKGEGPKAPSLAGILPTPKRHPMQAGQMDSAAISASLTAANS